jgi:hypothetical protein
MKGVPETAAEPAAPRIRYAEPEAPPARVETTPPPKSPTISETAQMPPIPDIATGAPETEPEGTSEPIPYVELEKLSASAREKIWARLMSVVIPKAPQASPEPSMIAEEVPEAKAEPSAPLKSEVAAERSPPEAPEYWDDEPSVSDPSIAAWEEPPNAMPEDRVEPWLIPANEPETQAAVGDALPLRGDHEYEDPMASIFAKAEEMLPSASPETLPQSRSKWSTVDRAIAAASIVMVMLTGYFAASLWSQDAPQARPQPVAAAPVASAPTPPPGGNRAWGVSREAKEVPDPPGTKATDTGRSHASKKPPGGSAAEQ